MSDDSIPVLSNLCTDVDPTLCYRAQPKQRSQLVQLDQSMMPDELRRWLADRAVLLTTTFDLPQNFTPGQTELDTAKVAAMVELLRQGKKLPPPLASGDRVIVDGNHRWAARRVFAPTTPTDFFITDVGFDETLSLCRTFAWLMAAGPDGVVPSPEAEDAYWRSGPQYDDPRWASITNMPQGGNKGLSAVRSRNALMVDQQVTVPDLVASAMVLSGLRSGTDDPADRTGNAGDDAVFEGLLREARSQSMSVRPKAGVGRCGRALEALMARRRG